MIAAMRVKRKLNIVELYAGTGRSTEPFRDWHRSRIALLVDNEEFAKRTYQLNYPSAPYLRADLSRLKPSELQNAVGGPVDVLLGCPPCQGFSDTGLRDVKDKRNAHLYRFQLYAEHLRPLAVAMENVPLAVATGVRFTRFALAMEALGYEATWGVLNAALRGSAQNRHRLVYIAIHKSVGVSPQIPAATHGATGQYFHYGSQALVEQATMVADPPSVRRVRGDLPFVEDSLGPLPIPTIGETIEGLPAAGSSKALALSHFAWNHTAAMTRKMTRVPEGGRWHGGRDHYSHAYGRLHRSGLSGTITTFFSNPGSGRFWHPTNERAISIREAARIQGFPDSFKFLPESTNTCRLVGNALDGALAQVTYEVIRSALM